MSTADLTHLQTVVARLLRLGVRTSAALLAIGLVAWFFAWTFAHALLAAGLIVLMAVPITRIIISLVEAAKQRDWLLVSATAFVLGVMSATLVLSLLG